MPVSQRIAVFGSANMDLVVTVARAPERGETVTGRGYRTVPGGKGANQAIAAARAGGSVAMIGAVGDDDFGGELRETLRAAGVDTAGLRTVAGRSGTAHIVVDDAGGNAIVVVPAANAELTGLAPGDEQRVAGAAALLLQLETPQSGVLAAAAGARDAGVPVVLTPAPVAPLPEALLGLVDLLVPNEHEAAALTGDDDPEAAAAALLDRVPEVVITLGGQGCLYAARGRTPLRVPAIPVPAVDTTAAGDTFCGALAVARAEARPMPDALRWASAAAALSVGRPGASSSMPTRPEINAKATGP